MRRILLVLALAAIVAAVMAASALTAFAAPGNNFGKDVKSCSKNESCYNGGSRGSYVNDEAKDTEGPGYGQEIDDLASPGHSNPQGTALQ